MRRTLPRISDEGFGDGVAVVLAQEPMSLVTASATITHLHGVDNARAGLGNFSASVALGQSVLGCNAIDLGAEVFSMVEFVFDDLGDNHCGCPEPIEDCAARSSSLEPPNLVVD